MKPIRVHYLSLRLPPAADPAAAALDIRRERLAVDAYLALYRAVGARWRWDQRLRMPAAELTANLKSAACLIEVLRVDQQAVGFCEFDCAAFPSVQLMNFGLLPGFMGRGLGRALLSQALAGVFADGASQVHLHTDEWDHPAALALYLQAGFVIERVVLEDPTEL